jgi:hypothetical protein
VWLADEKRIPRRDQDDVVDHLLGPGSEQPSGDVVPRRAGSSADKAETCQDSQMARVRRARREGLRS